jgi:hypothetical protein
VDAIRSCDLILVPPQARDPPRHWPASIPPRRPPACPAP